MVSSTREFSEEFLLKNSNYFRNITQTDVLVPPWTVATLLAALRALRDRVGAAARPDINSMIEETERGLEVAKRYRYR